MMARSMTATAFPMARGGGRAKCLSIRWTSVSSGIPTCTTMRTLLGQNGVPPLVGSASPSAKPETQRSVPGQKPGPPPAQPSEQQRVEEGASEAPITGGTPAPPAFERLLAELKSLKLPVVDLSDAELAVCPALRIYGHGSSTDAGLPEDARRFLRSIPGAQRTDWAKIGNELRAHLP